MARWFLVAATILSMTLSAEAQAPQRLKVSETRRFLVTGENEPFFWLGDTAWEIFHRLTREEASHYLTVRASQGFNVIQAVAIAEFDGHNVPNAYGHLPLVDQDPARPATTEGPNNDYWDHVDFIVEQANAKGIVVALLPTWGRYWHDEVKGGKPLFNRENARIYGEWIGRRYRDRSIVWVLGGDRNVENEEQKQVLRAMAEGLHMGDGGSHLRTFHPRGGSGSSQYFHNEPWLDFNMRQNGHEIDFPGRYANTKKDYDLTPPKPVLDAEPIYEDHPIGFNAPRFGHSVAADVRRPLYWDLFGGAFGHTYGNHAIWQMWTSERTPINNPLMPWTEAIRQPGAEQMKYGRRLIESRPFLDRVPDDSIIVADRVPTLIPGAGRYRFVATRDTARTYAMIYVPVGRTFSVRMDAIGGENVIARWYNPRDGAVTDIGSFPNKGTRAFNPPTPGEALDWILVLDDTSKRYPPPGTARGR